MNKKGFTLAEVLITLGIVGIVAALTVPAFISNKPCENKIKFQKAYTALSNITSDLVDDESLYYRRWIPALNRLDDCEGLACQGEPLAGNNPYPGTLVNVTPAWQKLAYLVASKMTIIEQVPNFRANTITYTTTDGTTWTFVQRPAPLVASVTIDVNDERDINGNPATDKDNTNTRYNTNAYFAQRRNATNVPDTFVFDIDRDGGVVPQPNDNGIFERYLLRHPSQLNRRTIIDDIRDINTPLDNK